MVSVATSDRSDTETGHIAPGNRSLVRRAAPYQSISNDQEGATPLHEWVVLFTSGVIGFHALVLAAVMF